MGRYILESWRFIATALLVSAGLALSLQTIMRLPADALTRPLLKGDVARRQALAARSCDPGLKGYDARSAGNPAEWLHSDDYPQLSILLGEHGTVRIRWNVGTDGRVSNCTILETSGFARLDGAACAAIVKRGLYAPARDDKGCPMVSTSTRRVRWEIPEG